MPGQPTKRQMKKIREDPDRREARETRALELYTDFRSYQQIADQLGTSKSVAHDLVARALAAQAARTPETLVTARTLMLARYERMLTTWFPLSVGDDINPPDANAADVVLKIFDRMARILGMDKGPGVEVTNVNFISVERTKEEILRSLEDVATRARTVEGTLALPGCR